ncbi:MAG: hypothetical protein IKO72_11255 [Kiritimatiellae bacterium]|nr:hypothetical protein [Kiritimatiellia bacterium]
MKRMIVAAVLSAGIACIAGVGDIVLENQRFRLVLGADARAKSLVVKATGEECLDPRECVALFETVQDRPFNNETKLLWPNKQTSYPAERLRREGDLLVVGFRTAPYEAVLRVRTGGGYMAFTLERFNCVHELAYGGLHMNVPPVATFRLLQLPVANRAKFGDWLNVSWDDRAAVAVVGVDPHVAIDHADRASFRLLNADLSRGMKLVGGTAAIVAGAGEKDFMDAMDGLEADFNLPRGVKSRQSPMLNRSIYWTSGITPANVDEHIAVARQGGFTMMLIYYPAMTRSRGYRFLGDYDWNDAYPNGEKDLRAVLAKLKTAGITPGLHTLQTHIGVESRYVTPALDPRLNKTRRFTLARPLPAEGPVGEIFVEENPVDSMLYPDCRVLGFGPEAFSYESYTTEPPYRFTGVVRGHYKTRPAAHPRGEVGGTLDVSEYGATSIYIDQGTSLQDEIALKIKRIYDCGFEFCYFDGSEGVNPPCGVNVSLSQYRVVKTFERAPIFTEGAAKSHFGWHLQAGANAFDVFPPEIFKAMIVRFPQAEAPIMRQNMTRVDFGWWSIYRPGTKVKNRMKVPYETLETVGTQPDMVEFGTSRAAAWNCPAAIQMSLTYAKTIPRFADLMEVMRRWEDVRAKGWLTDAQKDALKSSTQEHHLYLDGKGGYELHAIEMLPTPPAAPQLRGFVFERNGRQVIAYWHTCGAARAVLAVGPGGSDVAVDAQGMRYLESDLPRETVRNAFQKAKFLFAFHAEKW